MSAPYDAMRKCLGCGQDLEKYDPRFEFCAACDEPFSQLTDDDMRAMRDAYEGKVRR